jgi:ABC-type Co2+ transport system permease subunit
LALEFALNLVWLVLAVASLALWGVHTLRGEEKIGRNNLRWMSAIALVCILAVAFPVISMTDDLNSNPALCETNKLKKWIAAESSEAVLLASVVAKFVVPQPAAHYPSRTEPRVHFPLQELVWFTLDRRPPPFLS